MSQTKPVNKRKHNDDEKQNKRNKSPWDWVYQTKAAEIGHTWTKGFAEMSGYNDYNQHLLEAVNAATNCFDAKTQLTEWCRQAGIDNPDTMKTVLALYNWILSNLAFAESETFRKTLESKHYLFEDCNNLSDYVLASASKEQLLSLLVHYVGYNDEFQQYRRTTTAELKKIITSFAKSSEFG